MSKLRFVVLIPVFMASLLAAGSGHTAEVGVTAVVNPSALGTPPGEATRELVIGHDVFFNERIVTEGKGQTQILFVDQSSLTIGPGSDLVLDEFIYDPNTTTGKMAVSVTTGILRYIGGQIAEDEEVLFKTRHATIGIRGSSVNVDASDAGTTAHRTSGTMFCEYEEAGESKTIPVTVDDKVCACDDTGCRVEDLDLNWLKKFIASLTGDPDDPGDLDPGNPPAACGSDTAAVGAPCDDDGPNIPTPQEFQDAANLEEFQQDMQRGDLPIDDECPQEFCEEFAQ